MHHGGAKQHDEMLLFALEISILVHSTIMSWECVYSLLRTYVVVVVDN
jgi:hypothetical protein